VLSEPPQVRLGGGPAKSVLTQPRYGPVVDHMAVLVAPWRVEHLPHRHSCNVTSDDAVDEHAGVAARDDVLEERRNIDQRGRVSDRVVFVFVMSFIRADGVIPRPLTIVERLAQGGCAGVKRRPARQLGIRRERRSRGFLWGGRSPPLEIRKTEQPGSVRRAKRIERLAMPLLRSADDTAEVAR